MQPTGGAAARRKPTEGSTVGNQPVPHSLRTREAVQATGRSRATSLGGPVPARLVAFGVRRTEGLAQTPSNRWGINAPGSGSTHLRGGYGNGIGPPTGINEPTPLRGHLASWTISPSTTVITGNVSRISLSLTVKKSRSRTSMSARLPLSIDPRSSSLLRYHAFSRV